MNLADSSGNNTAMLLVVPPTGEDDGELSSSSSSSLSSCSSSSSSSAFDGSADMDLANGPNPPWLPAYGFQLQHHSHYQSANEDLRATDTTAIVQQVDFLETILEETSDDLQSDSDPSGTSFWLGSDSETESVIHIRTKHLSAADDERHESMGNGSGSGSDCNSVVPRKRRRRNYDVSERDHKLHPFDDFPVSPRSSRSSRSTGSSRSSSLLQFESLERTCATLSPSSYSFDSLEYSNRSNASHYVENTSPDSLEQDYDSHLPSLSYRSHSTLRPYRSFESLDDYMKNEDFRSPKLSNGLADFSYTKSKDLSKSGRTTRRSKNRDFWHENEEYEDLGEKDDELEAHPCYSDRAGLDDRLLVFGEPTCNYATSLDCRNTTDLREIGIETKRDAFSNLKSGQARLNINAGVDMTADMAAAATAASAANMMGRKTSPTLAIHGHHGYGMPLTHELQQGQHRSRGWSNDEYFNFRFSDKSQSAPSLLNGFDGESLDGQTSAYATYCTLAKINLFVSKSNLFENYTRVNSLPVDLNLCGVFQSDNHDEECSSEMSAHGHEMAELNSASDSEIELRNGISESEEDPMEVDSEKPTEKKAITVCRTSSVRTQPAQSSIIDGEIQPSSNVQEQSPSISVQDGESSKGKIQVTSTVKTQDRGDSVLQMAIAMENDIDAVMGEAIRQWTREAAPERPRRVKNNASYELAQQFVIDERHFPSKAMIRCKEEAHDENTSRNCTAKKKLHNNASYELAQQCDYIKALESSRRGFQRMDACDEREEYLNASQCLATGSASNLSFIDQKESIRKTYSKSTENVSTSKIGRKKQPENNENFISQIKKNSDLFSISGENANAGNGCGIGPGSVPGSGPGAGTNIVEDELDFPCLETKPINPSLVTTLESLPHKEHNQTLDDEGTERMDNMIRQVLKDAGFFEQNDNELTTRNNTERDSDDNNDNKDDDCDDDFSKSKKSFIGQFYPKDSERNEEQEEAMMSADVKLAEDNSQESANAQVTPTIQSNHTEKEKTSVANAKKNAGERLWRVVVEKKEAAEKEKALLSSSTSVGSSSPPNGGSLEDDGSPRRHRRRRHQHSEKAPMSADPSVDTNHRADREHLKSREEKSKPLEMTSKSVSPSASASSPSASPSKPDEKKKGGLGGFLQRFSRLRFSGRSKVPRSELQKKCDQSGQGQKREKNVLNVEQRGSKKEEPDYIIIPLHPPVEEVVSLESHRPPDAGNSTNNANLQRNASTVSWNGRAPVSGKPPLPPLPSQPPRYGALGPLGPRQQYGVATGTPTPTATSTATPTTTTTTTTGLTGATRVNTTGFNATTTTAAATSTSTSRRRAATDLGSPAAIEMAKARTMQPSEERRPIGLLETDFDETVGCTINISTGTIATNPGTAAASKKARSLLNLNHSISGASQRTENALHIPQSPVGSTRRSSPRDGQPPSTTAIITTISTNINHRPHKSMEFLLDKENLHFVKPPENELQKVGERIPSEHELRVQRSLQRLNVPDWYKNSPAARDGFRLKRHSDASQHGGWRALGSKTTSLSSLSSTSARQATTTGPLLSPSPTPPVFSRWSTSLLNSAGSSPASSARSSFNHRQPYLGWRSQERLTNPRTPAERLAQGILPQLQSANKQQQQRKRQQQQQQQQTTNQQLEVRNSIKEVTSAIVHYVQSGQEVGRGERISPRPRPEDCDDRGGARSSSPRGSGKLCWMESSFVGTKPLDSPETPMSLAMDTDCCTVCSTTTGRIDSCSCIDSTTSPLYLDLTPTQDETPLHHSQQQRPSGSRQNCMDGSTRTAALGRNKPSPGSTTLEDVLDSLLGLPSASRTPSPVLPAGTGTGTGTATGSTSIRHRPGNFGQATSATAKSPNGCTDLRQDLQESARSVIDVSGSTSNIVCPKPPIEMLRRKSEGSETIGSNRTSGIGKNLSPAGPTSYVDYCAGLQQRHRRVSFDNGLSLVVTTAITNTSTTTSTRTSTITATGNAVLLVRCRNNRCTNSASLGEARKTYKSCHNCSCLYCSRECRRAHWQRHRRTCLHSRAGSLCRQVLSSAKEDATSLKHISALARRGYASDGRGAVKCFFVSPEAAEKFVANGFVDLPEPSYVRWSDLLPSEMGPELYAELIRLCETYNPETRLVLYVAICVVSEVPTSGAVKWEKQHVSRCAKIRLDTAPPSSASSNSVSVSTSIQLTQQHHHHHHHHHQHHHHHSQQEQQQVPQQQSTSPCNITREMDSPETLVLTSLPGSNNGNTPRRAREISFSNIQRQLRLRGVSLRRHFPQVYRKLCSYVEGSVDKFAPITIYPRDHVSGKSFMCIIMLDAEPEKLQLLPTDSSRVKTIDISIEQD